MTDDPKNLGATLDLGVIAPTPWPPKEITLLAKIEVNVGLATLHLLPEGKVTVSIKSPCGAVGYATTGRLEMLPGIPFKLIVSCKENLSMTMAADGKIVGRTGDIGLENTTFAIKASGILPPPPDLDARNSAAVNARRQQLADRTPRSGRTQMPPSYAESGLAREIAQIEDLLDACKNGRLHHVYGLAARLRLLAARGSNLHPLVQLVAAFRGVGLDVYALNSTNSIDPPPSVSLGGWSLHAQPSYLTTTMDLDVWLEQNTALAAGKSYTNNQLIRAIADTVGAHFDPDLEPLVGILSTFESGTDVGEFTELERWVINTSLCIKILAQRLLNTNLVY